MSRLDRLAHIGTVSIARHAQYDGESWCASLRLATGTSWEAWGETRRQALRNLERSVA